LARDVNLKGLDTDVLRTLRRHYENDAEGLGRIIKGLNN
jgi:hypothetical protein